MYQLIVLFFEIAIFRKGPQDVPASPWVLRLILPVYVAVNLLILLLNEDWSSAFAQVFVDFLLNVGFSWPLLYFAGKSGRFQQTLSALIGADIVINCIRIPAVASLNTEAADLAYIVMMVLMIWHLSVIGHIFRHALDKPIFFGLVLALLYLLISSQVMALLFSVVSNQS